MRERRNELVLGGLLLVFAVVIWYRLAGGVGVDPYGPGGSGGATRVDLDALQIYQVDWEVLTSPRPAYDPAGRNIFQFGQPPRPVPPPLTDAEKEAIERARIEAEKQRAEALRLAQQKQQEQPRPVVVEPIGPPEPPVEAPPPKPTPPRVTYKFIGYIGPPGRKIAVLHDGKDLIFGRQGDDLGDAFRILEIGYESIKFGYTDKQFAGEYEIIPMTSGG